MASTFLLARGTIRARARGSAGSSGQRNKQLSRGASLPPTPDGRTSHMASLALTPGAVSSAMRISWMDAKKKLSWTVRSWWSMLSPPTDGILDGTFGYLCAVDRRAEGGVWQIGERERERPRERERSFIDDQEVTWVRPRRVGV